MIEVNKNNTSNGYLEFPTIGERIRLAIRCRGITQKELAKKIGISENALVNYVNNKRDPSLKTITKIADICYVEPSWIADGRINIDLLFTINASLKKIPKKLLDSIFFKAGVSNIYLNMLTEHVIEPSGTFIKRYADSIANSGIDEKILSSLKVSADMAVMEKDAQLVLRPYEPILEEIFNLLHEDAEAQKMVLNILKSFKKNKKIK